MIREMLFVAENFRLFIWNLECYICVCYNSNCNSSDCEKRVSLNIFILLNQRASFVTKFLFTQLNWWWRSIKDSEMKAEVYSAWNLQKYLYNNIWYFMKIVSLYSQTWANDHLWIITTCLQRPLFWSPVFHV